MGINTICGDHFAPGDISESGRLRQDAKPVFFPRQSDAAHDHSYHDAALSQDESEGIIIIPYSLSFKYIGEKIIIALHDKQV